MILFYHSKEQNLLSNIQDEIFHKLMYLNLFFLIFRSHKEYKHEFH